MHIKSNEKFLQVAQRNIILKYRIKQHMPKIFKLLNSVEFGESSVGVSASNKRNYNQNKIF